VNFAGRGPIQFCKEVLKLMPDGQDPARVVPVTNLREYFHDALHGALERQHVSVEHQTEHYVVNLLTLFARSEAL